MTKIIVANWKANKTIVQATDWFEQTRDAINQAKDIQVVVCGSFVTLPALHNLLSESKARIGAQNVSHLGQGAFTGEVSAEMLEGVVDYCVVGHSERKKYFGETEEQIVKKVELLLQKSIIPVLCCANLKQLEVYLAASKEISAQAGKIIFVYEPPSAISGGQDYHPETAETADENCRQIKEKLGVEVVAIYGGSVNPDNIGSFLAKEHIDGALPGQASLEPKTFMDLLSKASAQML